jgi:two-component system, OmpR family, sensor histidine kinase BaeS
MASAHNGLMSLHVLQRLRQRLPQRLRIVHQLALLLLAAVVVALTLVGGVVAWNLRSGFGEYLHARDDVQLDRFVKLLELRSAPDPSMDWLRGNREAMQRLVDEFASVEGLERPPPRRPLHWDDRGDGLAPPAPPPRNDRPPSLGNIPGRIQIFDPQGQWLAGRPQPNTQSSVSRAVIVRGQEVARVRLTREREPQGVDARFLQRQFGVLWLAIGTTLVISLLLAWWAARYWTRPLRALQQATRRMAQGELGFQIPALAHQGTQEFADLMGDVNRMSQALAALEAARRVWIAQISHELRTPLAVLRGEMESIEDGARQPTPAVLANLRDEVMQLIRLVNDLHTLSMADLGQLHCVFVPGDADVVLRRIADRFVARAAQHGLSLELVPGAAIPACWDFGRIEQLLTNLLENSLRYTHAPGRIMLDWTQTGQALQQTLTLRIEDTAPGVSSAQLPQLFEPLFRADAARGRQAGLVNSSAGGAGSGLGLSIAKAIVLAHQGQISATHSGVGGLCVTVVLPLLPAGASPRR